MNLEQFKERFQNAVEDFCQLEIVTGIGKVTYKEIKRVEHDEQFNKDLETFKGRIEEYTNIVQNDNQTTDELATAKDNLASAYSSSMANRISRNMDYGIQIDYAMITHVDVIDGDIRTYMDTKLATGEDLKGIREMHLNREKEGFAIVESRIQAVAKLIEMLASKL